MVDKRHIKFMCLKVFQPIGIFYIGVIEAQDLCRIAHADIRRIEDRVVEKFTGIQRPLKKDRVAEIKKYVDNIDACFPTSVILAIDSKNAKYSNATKTMIINNMEDVAQIIDGQHRIAGLEEFSKNFQIPATIFIDMDDEDMAMQFATVNLKQTKVNKSLAYDLYEYTKARSPQKTCHNIAILLNTKKDSPFRDMIKVLGLATGKPNETLTQAAFIEELINYISIDPMKDRDVLKRGSKKLELLKNPLSSRQFLRNLFIKDNEAKIAKNIWNYFKAVDRKWPNAWPNRIQGNILNRTAGFKSLMRFFADAYKSFQKEDEVISIDQFWEIFSRIDINEEDFTSDRYKPGSSGQSDLYRDLLSQSGIGTPLLG